MASKLVAEKYAVSRAWGDRLKPRRRETGEIAPRRQTRWRPPRLPAQLPRLAILIREQPDRTLENIIRATRIVSADVTTAIVHAIAEGPPGGVRRDWGVQ